MGGGVGMCVRDGVCTCVGRGDGSGVGSGVGGGIGSWLGACVGPGSGEGSGEGVMPGQRVGRGVGSCVGCWMERWVGQWEGTLVSLLGGGVGACDGGVGSSVGKSILVVTASVGRAAPPSSWQEAFKSVAKEAWKETALAKPSEAGEPSGSKLKSTVTRPRPPLLLMPSPSSVALKRHRSPMAGTEMARLAGLGTGRFVGLGTGSMTSFPGEGGSGRFGV